MKNLLISLLIHGAAWVAAVALTGVPLGKVPAVRTAAIAVELRQSGAEKAVSHQGVRLKAIPLSALGLSFENFKSGNKSREGNVRTPEGSGKVGSPDAAMSGLLAVDPVLQAFLKELHGRIDRHLDYPREVSDAKIEGAVSLNLKVNSRGMLEAVEGFSDVSADDPVLKVLAFRALRKALAEPGRITLPLDRRFLQVGAIFSFSVSGEPDPSGLRDHKVAGDALRFDRTRLKPRKSQVVLGGFASVTDPAKNQVTEYGLDQGGLFKARSNSQTQQFDVGIDAVQVYEWFSGLLSRKARIDPLEKYQADPDY